MDIIYALITKKINLNNKENNNINGKDNSIQWSALLWENRTCEDM